MIRRACDMIRALVAWPLVGLALGVALVAFALAFCAWLLSRQRGERLDAWWHGNRWPRLKTERKS